MQKFIRIKKARVHNLKNISLDIPTEKLVVITGLSGSGKSSLAFDTLYAEGQRRYVESLSAYARQFLEQLDKPEVESIEGLSPAISIDQKRGSHNPRSTVGTITEIQDYMRLLFASIGHAHCYECNKALQAESAQNICQKVFEKYTQQSVTILSPQVLNKKGDQQALLNQIKGSGFTRVMVDGTIHRLDAPITVDAKKAHTVHIVVDRLTVDDDQTRLLDSIETAFASGKGLLGLQAGEDPLIQLYSERLYCPDCEISIPEMSHRLFSFNSPIGACETCNGLGDIFDFDPDLIIENPQESLAQATSMSLKLDRTRAGKYFELEAGFLGFSLDSIYADLDQTQRDFFWFGDSEKPRKPVTQKRRWHPSSPRYWEGAIPLLKRRQKESMSEGMRFFYRRFMAAKTCPSCHGHRLRKEALSIQVAHKNIAELNLLPIKDALQFFDKLPLSKTEAQISVQVLKEILQRLKFLNQVGLGYLSLSRKANTLSGGEAQRIRLATQIGSGLTGVLYVLDEPSIGLHQKDNQKLIETLQHLRDLGNTVVVVEHDEETMRMADHIIDIGPKAGRNGGHIMAQGSFEDILNSKDSITAQYLSGRKSIPIPKKRRAISQNMIALTGVYENNLKHVDLQIPTQVLTVVTGVSGSGKSSLILNVLEPVIRHYFEHKSLLSGPYKSISGLEHIDQIISIDQTAIGRTPRSNPITYTGAFSPIRELFTQTKEAKMRGYKVGRFSFNVKGGRCENCEGDGLVKVDMHFLSDVYVQCESCKGKRYNEGTLAVKYKGHSISDVLNLTIDQALELFENIPAISKKLQTLQEVGLGYITLGQSATTLSGGEAQRIKLAKELSKRSTGKTLYILDEPTTGLHMDDVNTLLKALNQLVDKGNTMIIIEHNLDVIKSADYIVDLGPDGGINGGEIVAVGPPELIVKKPKSYTGQYLKAYLKA